MNIYSICLEQYLLLFWFYSICASCDFVLSIWFEYESVFIGWKKSIEDVYFSARFFWCLFSIILLAKLMFKTLLLWELSPMLTRCATIRRQKSPDKGCRRSFWTGMEELSCKSSESNLEQQVLKFDLNLKMIEGIKF